MEKIFKQSIDLFGSDFIRKEVKEVRVDTTVDGHTLEPQLKQVQELTGGNIKKATVDMGYKIKEQIESIEIIMPIPNKNESYYRKKQR